MSQVSDLLIASRAAHLRYRQVAGQVDKAGKVTVPYHEVKAVEAVTTARDKRQQAHDLDPAHTDPEWLNDKASHESLMAFYATFLA